MAACSAGRVNPLATARAQNRGRREALHGLFVALADHAKFAAQASTELGNGYVDVHRDVAGSQRIQLELLGRHNRLTTSRTNDLDRELAFLGLLVDDL